MQLVQNSALTPDSQEGFVLRKAILRLCDSLQISRKQLGNVIGLSEASVSRLYDGKRELDPHSKNGELAITLLRIYRSLSALMGENHELCQQWLSHHNHHLQAKPLELMESISGLISVANYLDAMRGKV